MRASFPAMVECRIFFLTLQVRSYRGVGSLEGHSVGSSGSAGDPEFHRKKFLKLELQRTPQPRWQRPRCSSNQLAPVFPSRPLQGGRRDLGCGPFATMRSRRGYGPCAIHMHDDQRQRNNNPRHKPHRMDNNGVWQIAHIIAHHHGLPEKYRVPKE